MGYHIRLSGSEQDSLIGRQQISGTGLRGDDDQKRVAWLGNLILSMAGNKCTGNQHGPIAFLAAYVLFFATLFTSIVVYRLSHHPLAKYPGPITCKISQLWAVVIYSYVNAHHYRKLLHDQYGPIVRIGPNELSVTDKDMLPYILGSQGMPKGPLFEGRRMTPLSNKDMEHLNLISTRDLQRHAVLRKAWNKAFANTPLRDYEELTLLRARQLINTLKSLCKEQGGVACVDIASWIGYFTFDFMGDMAFGGGFELMRDGDSEQLLPKMSRYACLCQSIEAYHADSQESPFPLIVSNSILAIIAGADTTATILKNAIFYLLLNPTYHALLLEEVDATFPPTETNPFDTKVLPGLPFLGAVINEVLRLQPPVPTSLQRAPARGTGGKLIGTHYIKEGTNIQVSPYVLHRDPRYFFPHPDKFWPDRWILETLDSQELVLDRNAFIPFSMGPANCAGMALAMLELRAVISLFIMYFDMEFDDNFDPKTWMDSLKDYFVLESGKLKIKLRVRRRKGLE
ncbi:high nitrogen upregulated cytochrome P450 monooxygenase 2 [Boletus coccyginus]|nr:high nitrogen upregulated cytochrome P450 monooxygenase 2 [Boletus coccyginus]